MELEFWGPLTYKKWADDEKSAKEQKEWVATTEGKPGKWFNKLKEQNFEKGGRGLNVVNVSEK